MILSGGADLRIEHHFEVIAKIFEEDGENIKPEVLAIGLCGDSVTGYVKEWNINGETVTLGVKKAE